MIFCCGQNGNRKKIKWNLIQRRRTYDWRRYNITENVLEEYQQPARGCSQPAKTLHYITIHYFTLHYIILDYIILHYFTEQNLHDKRNVCIIYNIVSSVYMNRYIT